MEDRFAALDGVVDAVAGYMGGKSENPTYQQVCNDETGHAETVEVTFDPRTIDYHQLLETFFENHDPTTSNRQGPNVGSQYRSTIFCVHTEEAEAAREVIEGMRARGAFGGREIVTEVVHPAPCFWKAEDHHQDYHARHRGSCEI
ncbi:MAG TPA: peptide-methionine (S)-S-oxide reductase MsrA [Planctomycetes bacterium]|nr:peptide-methionine (S)-S-oxide reductase MsrA [Planctomycetota bacterium]HIN80404.1 peptide-methionine (S)-S-oxide reductase [Planctomycetota bacterium]